MSKLVPIQIEKDYIALDKKFEIIKRNHAVKKLRLLKYKEKGYIFRLIRFSDTSGGVFAPPWKLIAMELLHILYKTKIAREGFFKKLAKRFPRTERTPSVLIPGKKVEDE